MGKWKWYLNRLRAMSFTEVAWRIAQKREERRERHFERRHTNVSDHVFNPQLACLNLDPQRLGIAFETEGHVFNRHIHLLGGYDYDTYKTRWHAGFQTDNNWAKTFSYDIDYKQNDHVGDARTNWELNRHFQFALLAKNYYYSKDDGCYQELKTLLEDWNRENPFLIGISWTSVMEIAIRAINWMYAFAFIKASGHEDTATQSIFNTGIVNMLDYVERHHSRYSSANNHLIIEASALALGGYAFGHKQWLKEGIGIMTEELVRQTCNDGVNKEMSLHYHIFVLEAYSLVAHCVTSNGDPLPPIWLPYIDKMSQFVCHSCYDDNHVIAFGDDDEGKVLDLQGGVFSYIDTVLQLSSLVTGKRYSSFSNISETVRCLYDDNAIRPLLDQHLFATNDGYSFTSGGYTFMRSRDRRVLIGIDHAPLGFGSIAAHGHADALSFQLMVDGKTMFADPGTFIYHCNLAARDRYRQTLHHNTASVEGRDQSEMLGAFIWGRKANCRLTHQHHDNQRWTLTAEHDGYAPIIHSRTFDFDLEHCRLTITDKMNQPCRYTVTFLFGTGCEIEQTGDIVHISNDRQRCLLHLPPLTKSRIDIDWLSEHYGLQTTTQAIRIECDQPQIKTIIDILPYEQ